MRILIVTQWFQPEPHFKGLPLAKELQARGHDVTVLTGFPNYPGGTLYPGYRVRAIQREAIDGVEIIRVPLFPSHDSSPLKRILNYLSFAVAGSILGPCLVGPADVAYAYHPPGTIGFPAVVLRWLRGIPFVLDINDLWPDTLAGTGMLTSRWALRAVGLWESFVYRQARMINVVTPGFGRELVKRGVPKGKISLIYNWAEEAGWDQPENDLGVPVEMEGRFNVLFAGNIGKAQGLDSVIDACVLLREMAPEVQFLFIGDGIEVDRLRVLSEDLHVMNVRFLPRVSRDELEPYLRAADVLLVHLRADPLFEITIPSKTQAYLAAGRPILMAVRGDAADLVVRAGAGVCCSPEDPKQIAGGVLKLLRMSPATRAEMGASGQRFYQQELRFEAGVTRLEECLRAAADAPAYRRRARRTVVPASSVFSDADDLPNPERL
jgi:glycosyltransferase involved in cell wall biosynthesis